MFVDYFCDLDLYFRSPVTPRPCPPQPLLLPAESRAAEREAVHGVSLAVLPPGVSGSASRDRARLVSTQQGVPHPGALLSGGQV